MATSIGALNVALTMNTAAFVADTGKARSAVTSMGADFNRAGAIIDKASASLFSLGLKFAGAYTAVRAFNTVLSAFRDTAALTPAKLQELGISIDSDIIEKAQRAERALERFRVTAKIALVDTFTSIPNPFADFQKMMDAARGIERPNIHKQPFANESTQGIFGTNFLDANANSVNTALLSQGPMQKYHADLADKAQKVSEKFVEDQKKLTEEIQGVWDAYDQHFVEGQVAAKEETIAVWDAYYQRIAEESQSTADEIKSLWDGYDERFAQSQQETSDEIAKIWEDYYQRQAEKQQALSDYIDATSARAFDNMTDLLIRGGETWRDYASVAVAAIRDIMREQLAMANGGKSSGIGALISAGFSAIFGGPAAGGSNIDLQIPGRASGGPVAAGSTYMVGENGPELFTAGSNGSITPNGGGSQKLHITIDPSPLFGVVMKTIKSQAVSESVGAVHVAVRNRGGRF